MRRLLPPAVLANVAAPLPPFLVGALGIEVRRGLGLSSTAFGAAVTVFFAVTAVVSPLVGRWIDRVGWLGPLRLGALGTAAALLALGLGGGVPGLVAALALAGAANALVVPATNAALLAETPAHRLGMAIGISQAAVPLAGVVAGLCVPLAAGRLNHHTVIALTAAIPAAALLLLLGARATAPDGIPTALAGVPTRPGTRVLGHRRALAWATAAGALATVLVAVLGTLFVVLLVTDGVSPTRAGLLLTVGGVTGAVVRVATGALMRDAAAQGLRITMVLLGAGALGCVLLAVGSDDLVVLATVLVFAGGWGWPAAYYAALLRRHASDPGGATGRALRGIAVGAMVGPVALGAVAGHGQPALAWILLAAVALLAMATGWRSDGLYRADAAES